MEKNQKNELNGQLVYSLEEVGKAVELLNNLTQKYSVIALSGSLGAGKTTLVQNFLKSHGAKEPILSPTFAYFNKYELGKKTYYHFDLYRLANLEEFGALGFDELLHEPNSVSLVEWPEVIEPLLTKSTCKISLDYSGFDKRILNYSCKL